MAHFRMSHTGPVSNLAEGFSTGLRMGFDSIPTNTNYEYQLIIEDDQLSPAILMLLEYS